MKNRWAVALLLTTCLFGATVWQPALPGYRFKFPQDHFAHADYKTEWWYYTGNLHTEAGRRFGFELTFFRAGVDPQEDATAVWRTNTVWLAHLALSDLQGHKFFHTQRMNRTGPGLAGASLQEARYWNGNWEVRWLKLDGLQQLSAVADQFGLHLRLQPEKAAVIQGREGVSQKGPLPGEASHYVSFTRLLSSGELEYGGQRFAVDGDTWMDHEFFSEQHDANFDGWDWFAIQLDNQEELMLYRLRMKSGGKSPYSSGTYIDAKGKAQTLGADEFDLQPGREWHSVDSGAKYAIAWKIAVPKLHLVLEETTPLESQELFSRHSVTPTYWEGAVDYNGSQEGAAIRGVGYLEMTGSGQAHSIF